MPAVAKRISKIKDVRPADSSRGYGVGRIPGALRLVPMRSGVPWQHLPILRSLEAFSIRLAPSSGSGRPFPISLICPKSMIPDRASGHRHFNHQIMIPPSMPHPPHPSTPSNASSTSSPPLFFLPTDSPQVCGRYILFVTQ